MTMFTKSSQSDDPAQPFDYHVALRRIIYVALLGAFVIFLYSSSSSWTRSGNFASVFSLGLMAAGAAMVSGGLLGFLFGVPHVREGEPTQAKSGVRDDTADQQDDNVASDSSTSYRPNTSLEQISDWLTKMLVGVGLVEIKVIPDKLKDIGRFVARGLGNKDEAQAFALTLLIFFSVCGFVFGFLWARLYLKRWFVAADQMRILGKKLDQLEMDARALAFITQKLTSGKHDAATDPKLIKEAIQTASPAMRAQIFAQAEAASDNVSDTKGYQIKLKAATSVFRGMIYSDPEDQYDRNHQELALALQRQKPPDLKEAVEEITKAIDIRNDLKKPGWQYYEFLRALFRIKQDQNYNKDLPSDDHVVKQILDDLRIASTDTTDDARWPLWSNDPGVVKWMRLNKIEI
jgi:hypothetical protein